ncbi:MAG: hypothetical protein ACYS67_19355 [Planctomycetota bacterium]|jgi:hypothetical protein
MKPGMYFDHFHYEYVCSACGPLGVAMDKVQAMIHKYNCPRLREQIELDEMKRAREAKKKGTSCART